jgi:hypothetical protein
LLPDHYIYGQEKLLLQHHLIRAAILGTHLSRVRPSGAGGSRVADLTAAPQLLELFLGQLLGHSRLLYLFLHSASAAMPQSLMAADSPIVYRALNFVKT